MNEEDTFHALQKVPVLEVISQWANYLESMNKIGESEDMFDNFVKLRGWKDCHKFWETRKQLGI